MLNSNSGFCMSDGSNCFKCSYLNIVVVLIKNLNMAQDMIKEEYISFEVARLLKNKNFDQNCSTYYLDGKVWRHYHGEIIPKDKQIYAAPTQAIAMKWLREVYKIHIIAEPCLGEGSEPNLSFNRWFWTILKEEGEYKPIRKIDEFPTYEKACEAAIKYALEHLI